MDPEMPKQEQEMAISPELRSQKTSKRLMMYQLLVQLSVRVLVIAFTLAGAVTMTTSAQSVTVFGIVMDARYTFSSSFRFKLVADSVVCGLSVLSVVLVISLNRPKSNSKNYFYLLLLDMVSVLLLVSGCSAAMAIGYVGRFGQAQTGWIAICDRVEIFCYKILVSIASSFLAVICLVVLTVMSAHKLKSDSYFTKGVGIEI